jgi:hypothetical protein
MAIFLYFFFKKKGCFLNCWLLSEAKCARNIEGNCGTIYIFSGLRLLYLTGFSVRIFERVFGIWRRLVVFIGVWFSWGET